VTFVLSSVELGLILAFLGLGLLELVGRLSKCGFKPIIAFVHVLTQGGQLAIMTFLRGVKRSSSF
jgi:hypothetical protein